MTGRGENKETLKNMCEPIQYWFDLIMRAVIEVPIVDIFNHLEAIGNNSLKKCEILEQCVRLKYNLRVPTTIYACSG